MKAKTKGKVNFQWGLWNPGLPLVRNLVYGLGHNHCPTPFLIGQNKNMEAKTPRKAGDYNGLN